MFRHTAATHLNQVAGTDITQHVLGHSRRANTLKYAHLNPDQYAVYMKKSSLYEKKATMIALIDFYRKELLKANGFTPSTVETYTINIKAFCRFAKKELQSDPVKVKGPQLLKWILHLKNTGIGYSRIENHHYALKSFFAFLKKSGHIPSNPAEALPPLITRRRQVTKPVSTRDAFKLLDPFDQGTWHGLHDYTMVAMLWTPQSFSILIGAFQVFR